MLYNIFLHPLRRIPGPLLFGSSRLPYVYCALTGQLAITLKRLHDRYGPVVRTASNEVSFIETSGWNTIYARKDGDGHVFPKNFDTFPETENLFPRTVFASNFADYVNLRKVLSPSFSEANLGHFEPRLLGHADKLLQSIEAERERRGDVDLSEMAHWMAFDVATDFVTGESFNSLSDPNSFFRGWLRQLSETWRFISFVSNVKQMTNALTLLQSIIPASVLQKRVDQLKPVEDSIRENLNQRSSGSSLLSNVQRLKSDTAEKAMGLSEPELVANAALIIVAGTDTVALMLPAIIHLVLRNESVHAKLISEIRGAYAADKQISSASAKKLPYLNACIQEAMRVYPATPEGLPRIVPGDGENICGHWVPGGVRLPPCQVDSAGSRADQSSDVRSSQRLGRIPLGHKLRPAGFFRSRALAALHSGRWLFRVR